MPPFPSTDEPMTPLPRLPFGFARKHGVAVLGLANGKARIGRAFVDFAGYCVEKDGTRTGLSRRELDLLRYFLSHPGQVLDRTRLLDEVWGSDEFPTTRTVDMHVMKLRKKVEDDPESPRLIQTVHGVGYRFDPAGEGEPKDRKR